MKTSKIIKWIFLTPVVVFLIYWAFSLAKCEILTILHGDEFKEAYKENTMLGDIDYLKVLNYSDNCAEVYFVSVNKSEGDTMIFEKESEMWHYKSWNTIWAAYGGNAENVVWPYWWHFIYCRHLLI